MNGIIGYEPEEIIKLKSNIENISVELANKIITRILNVFVIPMKNIWYSPEAVTWFKGPFFNMLKEIEIPYERYFQNYINSIQLAADIWTSELNTQKLKVAPFNAKISGIFTGTQVINVINNNIKAKNIKGDTGISVEEATLMCQATLPKLILSLQEEINAYSTRVDASNAFFGNGQSQQINALFKKISLLIQDLFYKMIEGKDSIPTTINSYLQKYKLAAKQIEININNIVMDNQKINNVIETSQDENNVSFNSQEILTDQIDNMIRSSETNQDTQTKMDSINKENFTVTVNNQKDIDINSQNISYEKVNKDNINNVVITSNNDITPFTIKEISSENINNSILNTSNIEGENITGLNNYNSQDSSENITIDSSNYNVFDNTNNGKNTLYSKIHREKLDLDEGLTNSNTISQNEINKINITNISEYTKPHNAENSHVNINFNNIPKENVNINVN